jgi:hypothetical protein
MQLQLPSCCPCVSVYNTTILKSASAVHMLGDTWQAGGKQPRVHTHGRTLLVVLCSCPPAAGWLAGRRRSTRWPSSLTSSIATITANDRWACSIAHWLRMTTGVQLFSLGCPMLVRACSNSRSQHNADQGASMQLNASCALHSFVVLRDQFVDAPMHHCTIRSCVSHVHRRLPSRPAMCTPPQCAPQQPTSKLASIAVNCNCSNTSPGSI